MDNKQLAELIWQAGLFISRNHPAAGREISEELFEAVDELEDKGVEPVGWQFRTSADCPWADPEHSQRARRKIFEDKGYKTRDLYAEPPAPQVPDGYTAMMECAIRKIYRRMDAPESFDSVINEICRDALAAAPKPKPSPQVPDGWLIEESRLRSIVVAAIRRVTGCPDITGNGASLVDSAVAEARAMLAAAPQPKPAFQVPDLQYPNLAKGDYVLATKWHDGDPQDHWFVGFFDSMLPKANGDRFNVVDENGNLARGNGFRRVEKISARQGRWLLENAKNIESSVESVWTWLQRAPQPGES